MSKTTKKWLLYLLPLYIFYSVVSLVWTSRDEINAQATRHLFGSHELQGRLGGLRYVILLGARERSTTSNNGEKVWGTLSCSRRTYFAVGERASEIVAISLRADTRDVGDWKLLGIEGAEDKEIPCVTK